MNSMNAMNSISERVAALPWAEMQTQLQVHGSALGPQLLTNDECSSLIHEYDDDIRYRSTIDMQRYRFGSGQYRYFKYPLPLVVDQLRAAFWPNLLPIARTWWEQLNRACPWPDDFDEWLARCANAGQPRPTPLILRYGSGDWNALHRDLYGDMVFPIQVVVALSDAATDYAGGEFITVEQRPRAQSVARAFVVPKGCPFVFATRDRPTKSARGFTASPMRHGVSEVRTGSRHALGLLFHDAT
jgi:uncharacterized protein